MYHNKPTHPWWNSPLTAVLIWRFVPSCNAAKSSNKQTHTSKSHRIYMIYSLRWSFRYHSTHTDTCFETTTTPFRLKTQSKRWATCASLIPSAFLTQTTRLACKEPPPQRLSTWPEKWQNRSANNSKTAASWRTLSTHKTEPSATRASGIWRQRAYACCKISVCAPKSTWQRFESTLATWRPSTSSVSTATRTTTSWYWTVLACRLYSESWWPACR